MLTRLFAQNRVCEAVEYLGKGQLSDSKRTELSVVLFDPNIGNSIQYWK